MTRLLTVDVLVAPGDRRAALERDVRTGLTATPKWLTPVWFYDDHGSALFDEITRLPEYYLTRAERAILTAHAGAIAAAAGADTLVELGSGTSEKTRLLLDAMAANGSLRRFVPFDIAEGTLRRSAAAIADDYGVEVCGIVGDFDRHLDRLPNGGRRLVCFLGSTIGNLRPLERHRFLTRLARTMADGDGILLGTDLVKAPARLLAAYDDTAGVTAAFNGNVLTVLNRDIGADFVPEGFTHLARWNAEERWIEMRLRSVEAQTVRLGSLGIDVHFAAGEELLTEISAKFTVEGVDTELGAAGFRPVGRWLDPAGDFMVTLARRERVRRDTAAG